MGKPKTLYIMIAKYVKNIQVLDSLVASKEITADGRAYIIQALDPFHDWDTPPVGVPDSLGDRSVVVCVNQTVTVSAPDGADTWDCHAVLMPVLVKENWVNGTVTGIDIGNGSQNFFGDVGTLTIVRVPAGALTFPENGGPMIGHSPANNFALDMSAYTATSSFRLVSLGFECHNSSPEVFKSGSVVTYRMPNSRVLTGGRFEGNTRNDQVWRVRTPPARVQDALAYPSSKHWPAAEGNYTVGVVRPTQGIVRDYNSMVFMTRDSLGNTDQVQALVQRPEEVDEPVGRMWPDVDLSGAYYHGLNNQTTLTFTLKAYLELFPIVNDGVVSLLTSPSPAHDQAALDILARVVHSLPPAVKVADNEARDWWAVIQKAVAYAVPRAALAFDVVHLVRQEILKFKQHQNDGQPARASTPRPAKPAKPKFNESPQYGRDSIKTKTKPKKPLINANNK